MPELTSEFVESEYNARLAIPEHPEIFRRWAEQGAAARARLGGQLNIAYGASEHETLDWFPAPHSRGMLVLIHGGYWRSLDKADHSFVATPFVDAGAMVVVPNYSLCPAVTVDTIALQSAQALAWVHRNAARYGADAARLVVVGHSAGGHLAAMLLACDGRRLAPDLPPRLVRRAVSISGLYDLAPIAATPSLQVDLRLTPEVIARASPVRFAAPAGAWLASVVGALESEEFLRQNRSIRERWGSVVVPVCEELPGRNHFNVLDELVESQGALHRRVVQWLNE
jgi:arylformamidase